MSKIERDAPPTEGLKLVMNTMEQTEEFGQWLGRLQKRDSHAWERIDARLFRVSMGNLGDFKSVGSGVLEFRIDYGSGYRIYFTWRKGVLLLLWGGTKATQSRDIKKAEHLAENL